MIQLISLIICVITFIMGIAVLINNPKSVLFRLYFLLSVFSSLWILVNLIVIGGNIVVGNQALLIFARLITPLSLAVTLTLNLFVKYFRRSRFDIYDLLIVAPNLSIAVFSFTPFNVYLEQDNTPKVGSMYYLYLGVLLMNVVFMLHNLFYNNQASQKAHMQFVYLRFGIIFSVVPAILFGSITPVFIDNNLSDISPLFAFIFLVFAAVAIVKHRLFDIRGTVARTMGYLFTYSTLVGLYIVIVFILGSFVYGGAKLTMSQHLFYIGVALVFALTLPRLRHVFNKLTNKIFFQDAYEVQDLIDELNQTVIKDIRLQVLLKNSAEVIRSNIKTESVVFCIKETGGLSGQIIGNVADYHLRQADIDKISVFMSGINSTVIQAEELDGERAELKDILTHHGIGMLAYITTNEGDTRTDLGYILLGYKLSGNAFNNTDRKAMDIISNSMVVAIQNSMRFEEIQKFNETLQAKVDDATRKLQRTNDKLKQLDETKDEFISMASHQLRTPLTSVKGYLSMVLEGDVGTLNDMQRKLLMQSFNSSQRMVYLISDLLNLSRLRTGKFIIEPKVTNLADVIEGEVEQLSANAKGRGLTLNYNKPKNFPDLYMDETKIRQVIMNFADNAIYYTPSGGKIDINLVNNKDTIEFTVVDNGIGVPLADQKHMFTKFYRAKNAQKARPDGTGLGIFMAKKVIIAQGGALIFESKPDKGSTFGFSISKSGLKVPE